MKLMHKLTVNSWAFFGATVSSFFLSSIVCIQPSSEELSLFESKQKLSWSSLNEHLINHLYNALHGLRREIHLIHEKSEVGLRRRIFKSKHKLRLSTGSPENFFLGYRYSAVGRLLMAIKISQKNQRFLDGFSFFAAAVRCCRVVSLSLLLPVLLQFFCFSSPFWPLQLRLFAIFFSSTGCVESRSI